MGSGAAWKYWASRINPVGEDGFELIWGGVQITPLN